MSQDHLDRLRKLRAARGESVTRLEVGRGSQQQGSWPGVNPVQPGRAGGHGGRLLGLLLLILIAGGAISGVAIVLNKFHSSVGGPRKVVSFEVKPGEGVSSIASALQNDGLVQSSLIMRIYYLVNGGTANIKAGRHTLSTDMSPDKIAQALQTPPPAIVTHAVSTANQYNILAGKRAEEIATILDKNGVASYAAVMHEVTQGTYNYWFLKGRPPGASLEGFLAPGEYTFLPHSNAHSVVALMLRKFGQQFTPAIAAQARKQGRSIFDVVTMASIVQREDPLPKVQRYIAGVYYNRLKNIDVVDMRLDADPTVQYALGYSQTEHTWWRKDLNQQLDSTFQSPYNTYIVQGLPPGPISNPGPSALHAALNPAPSSWLFFQVLTKDNVHSHTYFCATLDCQTSGAGVAVQ